MNGGSVIRILVDQDKCCASGQCLMAAPEVFDLDDDGYVVVLQENPNPEQLEAARIATEQCPTAAITIVE